MTDKHKIDRRIERTKAALRDALLILVRCEDWADINVRAICHEANVARSSFYLHFDNKTDLLDNVFASGMQEAKAYVRANSGKGGNYASISWLVDHVSSNNEFFHKGPLSSDVIYLRFQRSFAELLKGELCEKQTEVPKDVLSFVVGGIFSALQEWDFGNKDLSVPVLTGRINRLADLVLSSKCA